MSRVIDLPALSDETLQRLDKALADRLARLSAGAPSHAQTGEEGQGEAGEDVGDLSRTRLQALIRDGHLRIDGGVLRDPSAKVRVGSSFSLTVPEAAPAVPQGENLALAIVYEDDDLVVVDKPAGLVVHPAAGHDSGTLVNALIAHCGASLSGVGGVKRPGIVHRLDKDTSGLLVVAKNDRAHQGLAAQFADHGRSGPLERAYLALVWGVPERQRGTVEAPLDRDPRNREKIAVTRAGRGRHAVTHWHRIAAFHDAADTPVAALLECRLETGRTHQIRVHMAHIGHPLVGDATYGAGFRTKAARLAQGTAEAVRAFPRQALHAALLGFAHPRTGQALRFESPLPADMAALLEAFGQRA